MNKMLSSWKEIAHFFGKGVRTVQRWEKTLDLPIRRPPGAPSNVVLARTSDLEEWMHRSSARRELQKNQEAPEDALRSAIDELDVEVNRLLEQRTDGKRGHAPAGEVHNMDSADPLTHVRQITEALRELIVHDSSSELKKVA